MGWFILAKLFSVLISLIHLGCFSEPEKDLEILLLRQQISILLRNHDQPIRATRFEKLTLAVIAAKLKELTHRSARQMEEVIQLFHPETVLSWHREFEIFLFDSGLLVFINPEDFIMSECLISNS